MKNFNCFLSLDQADIMLKLHNAVSIGYLSLFTEIKYLDDILHFLECWKNFYKQDLNVFSSRNFDDTPDTGPLHLSMLNIVDFNLINVQIFSNKNFGQINFNLDKLIFSNQDTNVYDTHMVRYYKL